jgi:heme-degrading monooxygenase HmoA
MLAVIFEFKVRAGREADYFRWGERLGPELAEADGFLAIERFESRSEEGKFVSISYWRDEAAVRAWRAHPDHSMAQAEGRARIFSEFRLRVAEVVREITLSEAGERTLREGDDV